MNFVLANLEYFVPLTICITGCFLALASPLYAQVINMTKKGEFYTLFAISLIPVFNIFLSIWQFSAILVWTAKKIGLPGHLK